MVETQVEQKAEAAAQETGNFLTNLWDQARKAAEQAQKAALDAADAAKKAAEDAAEKAKEAASQVQGNAQGAGQSAESGNFLSNMWEQAQKAAEQAQKSALEAADAAKKVADDAAAQAKNAAEKAQEGLGGSTGAKASEDAVKESGNFFESLWGEARKAAEAAQKAAADAAEAAKKAGEETAAKAMESAGSIQKMGDSAVKSDGSQDSAKEVKEQAGNFFSDAWNNAQKAAEAAQKAVVDAAESSRKAVSGSSVDQADKTASAGGNLLTDIWTKAQEAAEQARKAAQDATDAAQKAAQDAANSAKAAADSAQKSVSGGAESENPAGTAAQEGGNFLTGLWERAQKAAEQAQKAATDAAEAAKKAAEDAAAKAKETAEAAQKSVGGEAKAEGDQSTGNTDFITNLWQQAQKAAEQAAESAKAAAEDAANKAKEAAAAAQTGITGQNDADTDQKSAAANGSSNNIFEDLWRHAEKAAEAAKNAAEEAAKVAKNAAEDAANKTKAAAESAQSAVSGQGSTEEGKNPDGGFLDGMMATARTAASQVQQMAGDAANTARKVAEDAASEAAAAGQRAAALAAMQGLQSVAAKYPPGICQSTPLIDSKMRVATLNVWWKYGPWEERQPAILATLKHVNADVVCLQEVWKETAKDGKSQAKILAEQAGYDHHVFEGKREINGVLFGNAILSRWPIKESTAKVLPPFGCEDENRNVLRALIEGPRGNFQVFVTHLNWNFAQSDVRVKQTKEICKFIVLSSKGNTGDSFPPILCGDFNAVPDSDEIRKLIGKAEPHEKDLVFVDAWEAGGSGLGHTWSNENVFAAAELLLNRRVDYIFVGYPRIGGCGHVVKAEVMAKDIVFTDAKPMLPSDHYGVFADLRY